MTVLHARTRDARSHETDIYIYLRVYICVCARVKITPKANFSGMLDNFLIHCEVIRIRNSWNSLRKKNAPF